MQTATLSRCTPAIHPSIRRDCRANQNDNFGTYSVATPWVSSCVNMPTALASTTATFGYWKTQHILFPYFTRLSRIFWSCSAGVKTTTDVRGTYVQRVRRRRSYRPADVSAQAQSARHTRNTVRNPFNGIPPLRFGADAHLTGSIQNYAPFSCTVFHWKRAKIAVQRANVGDGRT